MVSWASCSSLQFLLLLLLILWATLVLEGAAADASARIEEAPPPFHHANQAAGLPPLAINSERIRKENSEFKNTKQCLYAVRAPKLDQGRLLVLDEEGRNLLSQLKDQRNVAEGLSVRGRYLLLNEGNSITVYDRTNNLEPLGTVLGPGLCNSMILELLSTTVVPGQLAQENGEGLSLFFACPGIAMLFYCPFNGSHCSSDFQTYTAPYQIFGLNRLPVTPIPPPKKKQLMHPCFLCFSFHHSNLCTK